MHSDRTCSSGPGHRRSCPGPVKRASTTQEQDSVTKWPQLRVFKSHSLLWDPVIEIEIFIRHHPIWFMNTKPALGDIFRVPSAKMAGDPFRSAPYLPRPAPFSLCVSRPFSPPAVTRPASVNRNVILRWLFQEIRISKKKNPLESEERKKNTEKWVIERGYWNLNSKTLSLTSFQITTTWLWFIFFPSQISNWFIVPLLYFNMLLIWFDLEKKNVPASTRETAGGSAIHKSAELAEIHWTYLKEKNRALVSNLTYGFMVINVFHTFLPSLKDWSCLRRSIDAYLYALRLLEVF